MTAHGIAIERAGNNARSAQRFKTPVIGESSFNPVSTNTKHLLTINSTLIIIYVNNAVGPIIKMGNILQAHKKHICTEHKRLVFEISNLINFDRISLF